MNEGFDTDISKIFTDSKLFTQNITVNSKLIYFQIFLGRASHKSTFAIAVSF